MASPKKLETRVEHKLSVTGNKKEERMKRVQRAQWLRAAILGANDGLLSTTSLMLGVGAAKEDQRSMILSGLAGTLAGACSMAVGEFVSVSTQRDIESAAIEQCSSKDKLHKEEDDGDIKLQITSSPNPAIIDTPGQNRLSTLSPGRSPLMKVVISDVRTNNAHEVEEEDGEEALPNPYKAAVASASAFVCGSLVPLVSAICVAENTARIEVIVVVTSIALVLFGGIGAYLGGSPLRASATRVLLGGWISMAVTYSFLKLLDRDDKGKHTD